jgi:hypothetical protein
MEGQELGVNDLKENISEFFVSLIAPYHEWFTKCSNFKTCTVRLKWGYKDSPLKSLKTA